MTHILSDADTDAARGPEPLAPDVVVPEEFEDEDLYETKDGAKGDAPAAQPMGDDHGTPGEQTRVLTEDETLEKALEDTFPTSDPIPPKRIDGPNT